MHRPLQLGSCRELNNYLLFTVAHPPFEPETKCGFFHLSVSLRRCRIDGIVCFSGKERGFGEGKWLGE